MNLSSSEAAFFMLNREYRGITANSEKTKQLLRLTQENCFKNMKKDILDMVICKSQFSSGPMQQKGFDEKASKHGSESETQQINKVSQYSGEEKKRRDDIIR